MDFTREPVIETIITPKEGYKLVVRSSKGLDFEEYVVDAVEVVSYGQAFFFRSLERPKPFFVPSSDYEVLEVREARMVLKNSSIDQQIKIGGGKDGDKKKKEIESQDDDGKKGGKVEKKKRERRRHSRRRRGDDPETEAVPGEETEPKLEPATAEQSPEPLAAADLDAAAPNLKTLLPPPTTLISDSIRRYKGDDDFKDVFYGESEGEPKAQEEELTASQPDLPTPPHDPLVPIPDEQPPAPADLYKPETDMKSEFEDTDFLKEETPLPQSQDES